MALETDIPNELPYNDYFEYFGTDFKLHLIVYGRGYYQYLRAVPTGKVLQPKVWYLKKHKAWVTAGSDYMLRQWNLAPNTSDPQIGDPI